MHVLSNQVKRNLTNEMLIMTGNKLHLSDCGYYSVIDIPSETDLQSFYNEKYFQNSKGSYQTDYSSDELLFFRNKIMQRLAAGNEISNQKRGKFLDVGCGEGFALSTLKGQGWDVCGIDYSSYGTDVHNPDCSKFLKIGDFTSLANEFVSAQEEFDLIWLINVLEHAREPEVILKHLKDILAPGGVIAITVPNDFSELQKLFLSNGLVDSPYWIAPPEHLHYFTAESLKALVGKSGFQCGDMLADFPIDWFIANEESNYISKKSAGKGAHTARLAIENLMAEKPVDQINRFYRELANLGLGRGITAFLTVRG